MPGLGRSVGSPNTSESGSNLLWAFSRVAQDRDEEAAVARDSAEQVPFSVFPPQHGRSTEVLAQGCDSTSMHHR